MMEDINNVEREIERLESLMLEPDFWSDKTTAQSVLREISDLKAKREGLGKYERGDAILTIIAGAGGDDAEDFARMLFHMYEKYVRHKGWEVYLIDNHQNDHGGYRHVTIEISSGHPQSRANLVPGHGPYGVLKNETGVHRLVRVSPFNAKKLRHTSFALVEVLPKFSKLEERDIVIPTQDLKLEFSRGGGPGGQNVNKRETSVRVVHIPTNISVHISTERSQEQNRELALAILRAKIFKKAAEEKKSVEESMKLTKNMEIEWGNQIRSYVLHPYKMVKDHRTGAETSSVGIVLEGDLDLFIEAEKNL